MVAPRSAAELGTQRMNRWANGAIVRCDCGHSVYILSFGCLEKGRPTIMGRTGSFLSILRVSLKDARNVSACIDKNKDNCK